MSAINPLSRFPFLLLFALLSIIGFSTWRTIMAKPALQVPGIPLDKDYWAAFRKTAPKTYIGVPIVDKYITSYIAVFTPHTDGTAENLAANLLWEEFAGFFVGMWAICMVESGRWSTQDSRLGRLMAQSWLWGELLQLLGGIQFNPTYLGLLAYHSASLPPSSLSHLRTPQPYAKATIPTFLLITLSTASMFARVSGPNYQYWDAIWQPFPIWSSLISFLLQKLPGFRPTSTPDYHGYLRVLYVVAFCISFSVHVDVMYSIISSPSPLSLLKDVFLLQSLEPLERFYPICRALMQWDFFIMTSSALVFTACMAQIRKAQLGERWASSLEAPWKWGSDTK